MQKETTWMVFNFWRLDNFCIEIYHCNPILYWWKSNIGFGFDSYFIWSCYVSSRKRMM